MPSKLPTVARRRGWNGDPPATDVEATRRIVDAAVDLISQTGSGVGIADVAASLGVIRQTVYRYFPTSGALMHAAAIASADGFLDRLTDHVRGIDDPADALTEGVLFTLDEVGRTPHLAIVLSDNYPDRQAHELTSEVSLHFGLRMIERFDVDWATHGYDEQSKRDLVEFTLRIMLSYFVAPRDLSRSDDDFRRFVRRWLGESILAQRR